MKPTDRQREVLQAIRTHHVEYGFPISLRELGDELGIASTHGVRDHLELLEKKGLVRWEPRLARTLVLTPAGLKEVA